MQEMNLGPHLAPLTAAAAATRMVSAADGAWVVAELAGRWLAEEFTQYQEAPPVLKLIDPHRDAVAATANGWLLGRPGAQGALYLATGDAELTYRLSWLVPPGAPVRESRPLAVPPGIWAVKASFPVAEDRAVVVLWRPSSQVSWRDHAARREELWLATIDTKTGTLVADTTWTGLTPRLGSRTVQVGVTGGSGAIYLIDQAGGGSRLIAFDAGTLATRWSTELAPPEPPTGDGAALTVSGNGAYIVVVLGNSRDSGVAAEAGLLVEAATGDIMADLDSAQLGSATRVHTMAPGEGRNIFWAAVLDTRGERTDRLSLAAIMALDAHTARVTTLLDTAEPGSRHVRDAVPLALALDPGTVRHWVALPFQPRDGAIKTGRQRGEVEGLVEPPGGWYQPGRPRIDEWLASQQ
jgi:hypothetical protein